MKAVFFSQIDKVFVISFMPNKIWILKDTKLIEASLVYKKENLLQIFTDTEYKAKRYLKQLAFYYLKKMCKSGYKNISQ